MLRLDVVALLRTKRSIEFLTKSGIEAGRILVVANRRGQASELSMKTAENAIGRKIDFGLPDDAKTDNAAGNVGNPAVLEAPSAAGSYGSAIAPRIPPSGAIATITRRSSMIR